ncbi:MAG TPA: STAS domain-containing protein [Phycisphaerales bacterium]|nr:STAS domain-containing protein [Phycisphaerales bacterium]HMP36373.1 STAS domain-containing protein [Phycisphaerales bacterium]
MEQPPFREKTSSFASQRFENSALTVRIAGPQVGNREAPIIGEEVMASIDELGRSKWLRHVVIDLSDVGFMSSVGLGLCINIRNRATEHGSSAILYGVKPDLRKAMALMRLDKLFKFVDGRDGLAKALA